MARSVPETRDEILAAAAKRFAVTGYKGTSLQDIARDVGCSKAAVLYHFANKEAILTELMSPAIDMLLALDERLLDATGQTAQRDAVEGFVELALRFRREIALLHGEFPELLQHPAFAYIQRCSDRLRDALAGGSSGAEARVGALIVLAGIAAACAEFPDLDDDELRAALLAVARRALGPLD
ncbi:TetR family transcriptional regulator [Micromonospora sp. NBRC 101691]|uniref:TetR/AcrR family transcriptional regulator n=1 Tax=Micromonospora sp. NBRC 101691 TaxID=3032198 RepID=UPI0024A24ABB|nr:TetR family transcriptional regulator [Micromonospora sp. NBRC 101691]GLY23069.1 TetR family transcriptional regulator [Micromonospora sp. NBRC 101691]